MSTSAEKSFFQIFPPLANATPYEVQQASITGTTSVTSLTTGLATADIPTGKVYITFQVVPVAGGSDVYFLLGAADATVTTTTGWVIPNGEERSYWVNLTATPSVAGITSTGTATLKWYISSPFNVYDRAAGGAGAP